jgi:hypothetical protein
MGGAHYALACGWNDNEDSINLKGFVWDNFLVGCRHRYMMTWTSSFVFCGIHSVVKDILLWWGELLTSKYISSTYSPYIYKGRDHLIMSQNNSLSNDLILYINLHINLHINLQIL